METGRGKLLGITQAAKVLGVHPLTLRSWAEKGHIPHYRTPGGHRRFREKDLLDFLAKINRGDSGPKLESVAHRAVQRAIAALPGTEGVVARPIKGPAVTEEQRVEMRSVGQNLLRLSMQYVSGTHSESVMEEGRKIGRAYGGFARRYRMTMSEMVATFNFFRDAIIEAMFNAPEEEAVVDASNPALYRRLNRFFNEVLLSAVEATEDAFSNGGAAED
ncbi:MAG: helix-turn-helix domain-containing protein [Anaerolineae bacterium]